MPIVKHLIEESFENEQALSKSDIFAIGRNRPEIFLLNPKMLTADSRLGTAKRMNRAPVRPTPPHAQSVRCACVYYSCSHCDHSLREREVGVSIAYYHTYPPRSGAARQKGAKRLFAAVCIQTHKEEV